MLQLIKQLAASDTVTKTALKLVLNKCAISSCLIIFIFFSPKGLS